MVQKVEKKFWTWAHVEKMLLTLFAIAFFCTLLWSAIKPASHDTVTFNITGINTDNQNASSLVAIHFECIKYCTGHNSGNDDKRLCFEQCALLGKEVCPQSNVWTYPNLTKGNWVYVNCKGVTGNSTNQPLGCL